MINNRFWTQKQTKEKNEAKILKLLYESPKTFSELKEKSKLSQTGLSNILKRLTNSKKIEIIIYNGKPAYSLTENGLKYLKSVWLLESNLNELKDKNASYICNYYNLGQNGIYYHLVEQINSPFIDYDYEIKEISEKFLEKIISQVKNGSMSENDLQGKHIIAFEIDFDTIKTLINLANQTNEEEFKKKINNPFAMEKKFTYDTINFYQKLLNKK